jgi:hypothetical protein
MHAALSGMKRMRRGRTGEAHASTPDWPVATRFMRDAWRRRRPSRRCAVGLRTGGPLSVSVTPLGMAAKQQHAQLALQRLDLLAQRRLLHAQPLGGAGHVAGLGDGDEVAQCTHVHACLHIFFVSDSGLDILFDPKSLA